MIAPGVIGWAGDGALLAALLAAALQGGHLWRFGLCDAALANHRLTRLLAVQLLAITLAFLLLLAGYGLSDFSLVNVVANSHRDKPLLFKITGAWGNHEGSMLLWALIFSVFTFAASRCRQPLPLLNAALMVQGALIFGLLLFIWLASNPFLIIMPPMPEGQGLNPLLQDIGLAIHPPTLYLGYVGCALLFCYAVAAMLTRSVNREWAAFIQPWVMLSWGFLSLGIGLGSWWAYRELGWGGWWFWDPVENISLMPWLCLTALLHSNRVLMLRGDLPRWTLLLTILAYSMSLFGTFIVRSGLLVSVHNFASDPLRGLFLLALVGCSVIPALWLFARYPMQGTEGDEMTSGIAAFSRGGLILVNNLFLMVALVSILLATLYPMLLQLFAQPSITVGAPYYNQIILPLFAVLVALAGVAPYLPWMRGAAITRLRRILLFAGLSAMLAGFLSLLLFHRHAVMMAGCLALSVWLLALTVRWWWQQKRQQGGVKRHHWAMIGGHAALAFMTVAIALSFLQAVDEQRLLLLNQPQTLLGKEVTWRGEVTLREENYITRRVIIEVADEAKLFFLTPELRIYPVRQMQTAEAAIEPSWTGNWYATYSNQAADGSILLHLHYHPAMFLLWFAFLLLGCSGLYAASVYWRK